MVKINGDYEYEHPAALPGWLKEFADEELNKSGTPFDDIRNLFMGKKNLDAVETRVQELCKRVGLNKIAEEDKIHGGFGDNQPDERYDENQLEKGIKVELEHTCDPERAKEIAKDHLEESKDFRNNHGAKYYDKLEKMEDEIESKLSKSQLLRDLIILANRCEDNKNICAAKIIDKTIKKFSEMFAKDKSIFDKYPKVQKFIDNICSSRGGYIDVPAIMQMFQGEKFKDIKLSDQDKKKIKKYIEKKIKEEKKPIEEDDTPDMSYVVFVVNEDDGNNDIFDKPTR